MSKKKATAISLPISRTAKIMTSAVGVESVNQDIVATATKATEIFLTDFARRAYELSESNILEYDDMTNLVHNDPRYDFLVDTTPKRIKFGEALKLIEEAKAREAERLAQMLALSNPPQEDQEMMEPPKPETDGPEQQSEPPEHDDNEQSKPIEPPEEET